MCIRDRRSNSALDRRHRFTVTSIYDIPFFRNRGSFMKNVAGNWELVPVFTYETGEWVDAQSGIDANINGDAAGDRAILNPSGVRGTGSAVTPLCRSSLPSGIKCGENDFTGGTPGPGNFDSRPFLVAYAANNPTAQYITAAAGALATSSRNTLSSPAINNWDFAVVKKISITERMRFEIGAQFLNVLNHPEFTTGYVNQVTSLSQTGNTAYLQPRNPAFNKPSLAFSSNPRMGQLTAKFIF